MMLTLTLIGVLLAALAIWVVYYPEHLPYFGKVIRRKRQQEQEELQKIIKREHDRGVAVILDGLPQSKDRGVKSRFVQAMKHYRNFQYWQCIGLLQTCFRPRSTPSEQAALHILIGNCHFGLRKLDQALGRYRDAEHAAGAGGDNGGLAAALGNMGIVFQIRGELDRALEHYKKALSLFQQVGAKQGIEIAERDIQRVMELKRKAAVRR